MKLITMWMLLFLISLITQTMQAQTKPCVFCEIIARKIEQRQVVYKDHSEEAFLTYAPDNPGHVLVVPIQHARYYDDIPDSTVCNMMSVAKLLIEAIRTTDIHADGFRLMINSGEAAGQSVMHAHLHVIPRYVGETLNTEHKKKPPAELDIVADKIRNAITKLHR